MLREAYVATSYVASTPRGRLRVRVGEAHPELDALLRDHEVEQWAYITAWNPGSELLSPLENHERQKELEGELREAGYSFFRGSGVPDNDDWDAEESVLVLGISRSEAVRLGVAYGQNAIVHGPLGEVAQLVWCDEAAEDGAGDRPPETVNVFAIPDALPGADEFFEVLARGEDVRVERIISHGHTTPDGEWYDQEDDEWVVLLQGEATLEWEDGARSGLGAGDAVFIEAHRRHRVVRTSSEPPCVWLAVHGELRG